MSECEKKKKDDDNLNFSYTSAVSLMYATHWFVAAIYSSDKFAFVSTCGLFFSSFVIINFSKVVCGIFFAFCACVCVCVPQSNHAPQELNVVYGIDKRAIWDLRLSHSVFHQRQGAHIFSNILNILFCQKLGNKVYASVAAAMLYVLYMPKCGGHEADFGIVFILVRMFVNVQHTYLYLYGSYEYLEIWLEFILI